MNRIGIDLGGAKIDIAVLAEDGAALFEKRVAIAGEETRVGIGSPGSASPPNAEAAELVEELGPRAGRYSFSGQAGLKVLRARHGETSGGRGAERLWD